MLKGAVFCLMLVLCVLLPSHSEAKKNAGTAISAADFSSGEASGGKRCASNGRHLNASVCGLGYFCMNDTCLCRKAPDHIAQCGSEGGFFALDCYCVTSDDDDDAVAIGTCFFACGHFINASTYGVYLKVHEGLCAAQNRTGTLCGRCLPDHYPLAYSFYVTCIQCHQRIRWNWVRYIMAAYLPLTLFCVVIIFLKVGVVSSRLEFLVLFCQAMSQPIMARGTLVASSYNSTISLGARLLLSLYGVWNLDFFRPFYTDFCLGIGILPTLALDYVIAVYPLLLMIIAYLLIVLYDKNYRVITIMWRPFEVLFNIFKRNLTFNTSLIDAFSTFFLLSNIKFLSVSFDLLVPA